MPAIKLIEVVVTYKGIDGFEVAFKIWTDLAGGIQHFVAKFDHLHLLLVSEFSCVIISTKLFCHVFYFSFRGSRHITFELVDKYTWVERKTIWSLGICCLSNPKEQGNKESYFFHILPHSGWFILNERAKYKSIVTCTMKLNGFKPWRLR